MTNLLRVLFVCLLLWAQQAVAAPPDSITAEELKAHVNVLTSDEMRGRRSGQPGARKAAQYIANKFKEFGLSPIDEKRGYYQSFTANFRGTNLQVDNVIGILEGADPQLKSEVIVVGAHYDARGVDSAGNALRGADDNASSVAVMMELAQAFAQHPPPGQSAPLSLSRSARRNWECSVPDITSNVPCVRWPTRC